MSERTRIKRPTTATPSKAPAPARLLWPSHQLGTARAVNRGPGLPPYVPHRLKR